MASRKPLVWREVGHPGEDALEMSTDHLGDFLHRLDLRAQHVAAPAIAQQACNLRLLAGEDLAQFLAILPGACGAGGIHLGEQPIELSALRGSEGGAILQQYPALAREARVELLLDATHLVDRFRGIGYGVEPIEGDLGMGQMRADPADEGRGHVDADRLDLGWLVVVGAQVRLQRLDGGGDLALDHEDHASSGRIRIGIREERHVLVTLGPGGLIECHPPHLPEVGRPHPLVHILLAQRHDRGDRKSADVRGARKARLARQQHERLEQQREAREFAAPGRGDLHDLAVGQLHPRHLHLELALVLEEVQLPVGLRDGLVHRMLAGLPGHGKAAADLEVDTDFQLPLARLEVHPGDKPGTADAQCRLEDLLSNHPTLPSAASSDRTAAKAAQCHPDGVSPVGPQALATLTRPLVARLLDARGPRPAGTLWTTRQTMPPQAASSTQISKEALSSQRIS